MLSTLKTLAFETWRCTLLRSCPISLKKTEALEISIFEGICNQVAARN